MRKIRLRNIIFVFLILSIVFTSCTCGNSNNELKLNENSIEIAVGNSFILKSNDASVTWDSEDSSIAKVDARGKVVGVNEGITKIVATQGKKNVTCAVTVKSATATEIYSVGLSKTTATLKVNQQLTLTATVYNGTKTSNEVATFVTENEDVATVSNDGVITAKGIGETVVKAIYGKAYATCKVFVSNDNLQIMVNSELQVKLGEVVNLNVSIWQNGVEIQDAVSLEADSKIISIDSGNKVKGLALGETLVKANYKNQTAYCRVSVYQEKTISNIEEFSLIKADKYTNYNLTADIDFSNYQWDTVNIVPKLSSTLNGNGHKIYGLKRTAAADFVGVFGEIESSGKVENLAVYIDEFNYLDNCGAFAVTNDGSINNCYFKLKTYAQNTDRAVMLRSGLVQTNNGEMSGLIVDVTSYQGSAKTVIFNAYAAINHGKIEKSIVISDAKREVEETVNDEKVKYISYQLLSGSTNASLNMTGYQDIYRMDNDDDDKRKDTLIFLKSEDLLKIGDGEHFAIYGEAAAVIDIDSIKTDSTDFYGWFGSVFEIEQTSISFGENIIYSAGGN